MHGTFTQLAVILIVKQSTMLQRRLVNVFYSTLNIYTHTNATQLQTNMSKFSKNIPVPVIYLTLFFM